jgi:hypothetical protein
MLGRAERTKLWDNIVHAERPDPIAFLRGWFFDAKLESITHYDVADWVCWALYDNRNQEHLTDQEAKGTYRNVNARSEATNDSM